MIRDETEFTNNAVGIDPPDCGCTDCIMGDSINLGNAWDMRELAKQHLLGRPVINRTSRPLLLDKSVPTIVAVPEDMPHKWRFPKEEVTLVDSLDAARAFGDDEAADW